MLRIMGRLLSCLLLGLLAVGACAGDVKTIVAVDSYTTQYPWSQEWRTVLAQQIGARARITWLELDAKHLSAAALSERARLARASIEAARPDLVVIGDDPALERVGSRLARQGPILYLGINNNPRHYFRTLPANVTGVLERPLITRAVLNLAAIVPGGIQRALVLLDDEMTTRVIKNEAFYGYNGIRNGNTQIDLQVTQSFERWQQIVDTAPQRYQALWIGLYFSMRDANGRAVSGEDVVRWTRAHSRIPVFGLWNFNIGPDKAAGGLVLTGEEQGREAARIAAAILFDGTPPNRLFPVIPTAGRYVFSRAGVARYRLDTAPLPHLRVQWRD